MKNQHQLATLQQLSPEELRQRLIIANKQIKELKTRLAQYEHYKEFHKFIRGRNQEKAKSLFQRAKQAKFAISVAYIGVGYNGFVIQSKTDKNTVQYHLFNCLHNTNLVQDTMNCDYTRAARTDSGVSAFGNVIALKMRTNQNLEGGDSKVGKVIDHASVLNNLLPKDIRIVNCQIVPQEFNARYWCTCRSYKYYFTQGTLNLQAMKMACLKLIGLKDFRNICKIDLTSAVSFERQVINAQIQFVDDNLAKRCNDSRLTVHCFYIKANSFLWHQIRYTASLLFLIGSGRAEVQLIDQLLDIKKTVRKPNYPIAPDYPLVLQECQFEKFSFRPSEEHASRLYSQFNQMLKKKYIELTIFATSLLYISREFQIGKILMGSAKLDQKQEKSDKARFFISKSTCLTPEQLASRLKGKRKITYQYKKQKREEFQRNRNKKMDDQDQ